MSRAPIGMIDDDMATQRTSLTEHVALAAALRIDNHQPHALLLYQPISLDSLLCRPSTKDTCRQYSALYYVESTSARLPILTAHT